MALLPAGIPLKASAGLLQHLWRHGQVDLRVRKMGVPEIDRQVIHEPLHVFSAPIPFRQPVDGEGMPNVVHSWRLAFASRMPGELFAQGQKGPYDRGTART